MKFIEQIDNYEISLDKAINDQTELELLTNKLNNYNPSKFKKNRRKTRVLESVEKLSDARDEIINVFEKRIFPYNDKTFKTKEKEESEEELKENKFFEYIENESKSINYVLNNYVLILLFKIFFNFVSPIVLAKKII